MKHFTSPLSNSYISPARKAVLSHFTAEKTETQSLKNWYRVTQVANAVWETWTWSTWLQSLPFSLKGKEKQRGLRTEKDWQLVTNSWRELQCLNSTSRVFFPLSHNRLRVFRFSLWFIGWPSLAYAVPRTDDHIEPSAHSGQDSQTPQHLPPFGQKSHIESYFLF